MTNDTRIFRRSDTDFPITTSVQQRLIAAGSPSQNGGKAGYGELRSGW